MPEKRWRGYDPGVNDPLLDRADHALVSLIGRDAALVPDHHAVVYGYQDRFRAILPD
jgi:hypothetical protein